MEGADVRRAVAEVRDGDPRLAAHLEGKRGAGDHRQAAADDGVRAEVAALDVVQVHRAAVAARHALHLPVELRHQRVGVRAARERVPVGAVRRREDVSFGHGARHADGDRLLADGDVQEARQLAGAELLLDLLLEAPDEQHLAVELSQALLREPAFPGCLCLGHEPEFMLQAMGLVAQWDAMVAQPSSRLARDRAAASPGAAGRRCARGGAARIARAPASPETSCTCA